MRHYKSVKPETKDFQDNLIKVAIPLTIGILLLLTAAFSKAATPAESMYNTIDTLNSNENTNGDITLDLLGS